MYTGVVGILVKVLVVNAGAFGFAYLMRFLCAPLGKHAYFGYYIVLMPLGFAAWCDPSRLVELGFAMVGLLMITVVGRRLFAAIENT